MIKKVLIVDDDKILLSLFTHVLKPRDNAYELIVASNGKEAIEIIKSDEIHMVITDLYMPIINGFELVAYLANYHPEIIVYAMTAKYTTTVQEKVEALGSLNFIKKPINTDLLKKLIKEEIEAVPKSKVYGITLPSFLQLLEMEKKTCTLTVKSDQHKGRLYFINGILNAAETNTLQHEKAVFEMIAWDKIEMEIEDVNRKKLRHIKQPLMGIIVEGIQRKDLQEF